MRFISILLALLLIVPAALAESGTEPATIYYQGHASLRITTGTGEVIYIDPYTGDGYEPVADLILVTHNHSDHNQLSKIKNRSDDVRIITWKEALEGGTHQSFDLGYVKVEAVEAGYNHNHNVKSCVGYVLTFPDGKSVYVSGDTSTTPQMAEMKDMSLDYAFFCCDGTYNMDIAEAAECAKLVAAKHTIPYHYGSGAHMPSQEQLDALQVDGLIILQPGEELKVE